MGNKLEPMLEENLIVVSKYFDNGTPKEYEVTEKGQLFMDECEED